MPRYFFDVDDGSELHIDNEGTELANLTVARGEATETLTELAREHIPGDGFHRVLRIIVRDTERRRLEVTLSFEAALTDHS